MTYALVVAGKGGRRSLAAREVVEALAARGVRVGGFTQTTRTLETGAHFVDLVRVRGGATVPLAHPAARTSEASCSLEFERSGFEAARRWIEEDAPASDVLVLDGLGKLELAGEGHRATLDRALALAPVVVLAVRDDQLVYALEALGLGEPIASYTDGEGAVALGEFVAALAPPRARP
jgi:nucleoside-triphosphatase THEP1